MTPTEYRPLINQNTRSLEEPAELCLFRASPNGFPDHEVVGISGTSEGSVFSELSENGSGFAALFTEATRKFFLKAQKDPRSHYFLLVTKSGAPILVVTSTRRVSGLCLAVALPEPTETVLAYLRTIPQITCLFSPAAEKLTPQFPSDLSHFERLSTLFRRLFSLFESPYAIPSRYSGSLQFYALLRKKILDASALFGVHADFLMHQESPAPMPQNAPADMDLFSATILLLLFAVRRYGIEPLVYAVFLSVDQCPSVCLHFRVDSERYKDSDFLRIAEAITNRSGGYFSSCLGEHARKEAEKIHGIRHMMQNDRYAALGAHTINVFTPIRHTWTEYIIRSPLLRLPDGFYDGFVLPDSAT